MINIGDCIKIKKVKASKDGSTDVEVEYTDQFVALYKAATGKKRATKAGLKNFMRRMFSEAGKTWKKGGGIPCVIPLKQEET